MSFFEPSTPELHERPRFEVRCLQTPTGRSHYYIDTWTGKRLFSASQLEAEAASPTGRSPPAMSSAPPSPPPLGIAGRGPGSGPLLKTQSMPGSLPSTPNVDRR